MTNKQWIYVLKSDSFETIQLQYAPSGWNEQRVSIKRSPSYFGLTRSVSTSLRFFKDGKDFIQNVYERKGTEHEIYIGIYQYNPKPVDKFLLFFEGIIDLSTYTFNANDEGQFIEVDVNESSLARKLMSRDDIKVDLSRTTSIEGVELGANQRITARLHEREILLNGNYIWDDLVPSQSSAPSVVGGGSGVTIPIKIDSSNIDNLLTNPFGDINAFSSVFFDEVSVDSLINITGNIKGNLFGNLTGNIGIEFRLYDDDTYTSYTSSSLFTYSGSVISSYDFDIAIDLELLIPSGTRVAFIVFNDLNNGWVATYENINLNITKNELFDTTSSEGYLIHETAKRICEVIADKPNVLKSNVFGRTDIGYDSDGDYAYQLIIDGKGIRNIPNSSPSVSLKDFFDSLNAQRNLGLGIEYGGSGNDFIRIEDKSHFFSGEVIATIYNTKNLKKEVAREWIYNEVEVGYSKAEYEEVNGLEEYNNKFNWSDSIHTIKNKLNLISKIRADGYGIEFARRKQYADFPTEDTKYDNENFIIVLRKENNQYFSAKDENYTTVENIFSPETAYNLDITPGRMLRNNGDILRAGLWHLLDQPLVFSYAEQKSDLTSQRIDGELITENIDIDVNTFRQSRWIPEIYSFESVLTRELLATITRNPRGIIKFSTEIPDKTTDFYYGWILDIDSQPENQSATFQLLRVNIANPDVSLIDSEGNTPDIKPPIIPDEEFGFGGWFDFVFSGEDEVEDILTYSYLFTGRESITIPGIPAVERTQTIYFKANLSNRALGSTLGGIIYDGQSGSNFMGLRIFFNNNNSKIRFNLQSDSTVGNELAVETNTSFNNTNDYKIEFTYDGSSSAGGVTCKINDVNESLTVITNNLTDTTLGTSGVSIGKLKNIGTNLAGFKLCDLEVAYDGVTQFSTLCNAINYSRTVSDLSAQGNDGSVSLGTTPETDFYVTDLCTITSINTNQYAFGYPNSINESYINIPTLPTFERTQTLYAKFIVSIDKTGGTIALLDAARDSDSRGFYIWISNNIFGESFVEFQLINSFPSSVNRLFARGSTDLQAGQTYKIEVIYDGSSLTTGVTIKINDVNDPFSVSTSNLTGTTIGDSGGLIGRTEISGSNNVKFKLCEMQIDFDGLTVFSTLCESIDYSLTCSDLSGNGNNGVINLINQNDYEFFLQDSCSVT